MFGKCVLSIRAFSIIGCSRERVAHKYHRRKEAAPTLLVARGVAGGPRRVPRLPANVPPGVTRCSLEGYALVARTLLREWGGERHGAQNRRPIMKTGIAVGFALLGLGASLIGSPALAT